MGIKKASPNIYLERQMLKSEVFRRLPAKAIVILMDFLSKRQVAPRKTSKGDTTYTITNNGEIEYCFSEAEKKGISKQSFNHNRDILLERGFIDIAHSGCGGRKGDKNLYAISNRWRKWGTSEFEYRKRDKDNREGIGWKKYHTDKKLRCD